MGALLTILTVDDDALVREAFSRILAHRGYQVLQAADGEEALVVFRERHPDLVLLDLRMPRKDGLEVLSVLVAESPDTPVIVVSGEGTLDDAVAALRRGAWDFVVKPVFDPEVLVHAIGKAWEKATLRRENREYRDDLESKNKSLQRALDELREDQNAGRLLQIQLLPADGMRIDNMVFERRLFPSQVLSGDFVDYFSIGHDKVGFYMADVSGHGAASAIVTGILTALVDKYRQAHLSGADLTLVRPDLFLSALDRDLRALGLDKHITMFYGLIDRARHTLLYSNAGLFPYPVVRQGDAVDVLESPGRPLGLFAEGRHGRWERPLGSGGALLIFTDGVLELGIAGGLAQKKRWLGAVAAQARDLDDVLAALDLREGVGLYDDVALLMIRWGDRA